ncbi:winged helix-turn-helix transcriptional regulator [Gilvimarinus xylanilyticus]|uniref:Winged helix-turn-helix transcriptional regulator n=1 Tax=Gilvimarinus xylanilyticus TaxID=2944139 RepID=A0A9X2I072_9GAMM|nr:winged helix-turn-helix transcriptional regulator [Gilvimarinus xylanilyticus]MCP8900294.1 winged helix-turn-helix transcriptional regulator [Gilvimarinus xylanilyticus]
MLTDEYRYKILKLLEDNASITQRELAGQLDVSLGWVNACLKQMGDEQLIQAQRSAGQPQYAYQITPCGQRTRRSIAVSVLSTKKSERAALERDISELEAELKQRDTSARGALRANS